MSHEEPNEEELRAALEEQMRRIRVEDVIVQTVVTLINLAGRRLGLAGGPEEGEQRDPEQARLAIDGARALLPLLPEEGTAPIRDALSQLQVAYAREAQAGGSRPDAGDRPQPPPEQPSAAADDAERAKARSKLWTPRGS